MKRLALSLALLVSNKINLCKKSKDFSVSGFYHKRIKQKRYPLTVKSAYQKLLGCGLSVLCCWSWQFGCTSNEADKFEVQPPSTMELTFDAQQSDSSAIIWADRVLAACGGKENLEAVQYLSFQYVIKADTGVVTSWRHDWDRNKYRYRLAGTLAGGEQVLVFLNLITQEGDAFLNGEPAPEDESQNLLAMAYSRFIADTYWLLAPFKLKDPGARLQYRGMRQIGASTFAMIHLSFVDEVGLTPENEFNIFIDPATNEIRRWEYFASAQAQPLGALWENWQNFGALRFATARRLEESGRTILLENIIIAPEVDEQIFTVPAQTQAGMH